MNAAHWKVWLHVNKLSVWSLSDEKTVRKASRRSPREETTWHGRQWASARPHDDDDDEWGNHKLMSLTYHTYLFLCHNESLCTDGNLKTHHWYQETHYTVKQKKIHDAKIDLCRNFTFCLRNLFLFFTNIMYRVRFYQLYLRFTSQVTKETIDVTHEYIIILLLHCVLTVMLADLRQGPGDFTVGPPGGPLTSNLETICVMTTRSEAHRRERETGTNTHRMVWQ